MKKPNYISRASSRDTNDFNVKGHENAGRGGAEWFSEPGALMKTVFAGPFSASSLNVLWGTIWFLVPFRARGGKIQPLAWDWLLLFSCPVLVKKPNWAVSLLSL